MKSNRCITCNQPCDYERVIIRRGVAIEGCENCLDNLIKINDAAAKHNREWQKKQYRRELTQPNQRAFGHAYPDKARDYWDEETARKNAY